MDVLWIFHRRVEVEFFYVDACKPSALPRDDTVEHELNEFQRCCIGPCVARIANQVTPDCDPCAIFIIFFFAYFTHHLRVGNLFSFLVWDVGICYEVESVAQRPR
jgi:hypothetical protein